jgi:nucleoside-diphosphate kinase
MVKPDGVQHKLVGTVIARLEQKGLQLVALKLMRIPPEQAARHYAEHSSKPFFKSLISFITAGPVVAMVWKGKDAVNTARTLIGATDPRQASPGSIRGDLAISTAFNLVHGSDSLASADREIALFFDDSEICEYRLDTDHWVYEPGE